MHFFIIIIYGTLNKINNLIVSFNYIYIYIIIIHKRQIQKLCYADIK